MLLLTSAQKYLYKALPLLPGLCSRKAHTLCSVALFMGFLVFAPLFTKFISLQELKQQYCPLAEERFAAEKSEVSPVPAVLQGVGTAV